MSKSLGAAAGAVAFADDNLQQGLESWSSPLGSITVYGPEGPSSTIFFNPAAGFREGAADGGGGAGGPPVDWATTTAARRLLAKRLKAFEETNCDRVFAEVLGANGIPYSADRLRESARRTNFYNLVPQNITDWIARDCKEARKR